MQKFHRASRIVECNIALADSSAAHLFPGNAAPPAGSAKLPDYCKPGDLARELVAFDKDIFLHGGSAYVQDIAFSSADGTESLLDEKNKELLKLLELSCVQITNNNTDWQSCAILLLLTVKNEPQLVSLLGDKVDPHNFSNALCTKGELTNHPELCIHKFKITCLENRQESASCQEQSSKMLHLCSIGVSAACYAVGRSMLKRQTDKSPTDKCQTDKSKAKEAFDKACSLAMTVRNGCPHNQVLPLSPCDDSGRLACIELARAYMCPIMDKTPESECHSALTAIARAKRHGEELSEYDQPFTEAAISSCNKNYKF